MITSLRLVNFKNFADETLRLGPFTVIVGANASGKSNIRDAFRFLHGIGRGYTLAEILGGKYGAGGQLEWAGIRGAMNEIARFREDAFSLALNIGDFRYSVEASSDRIRRSAFRVTQERLRLNDEPVFRSHPIHGSRLRAQGYDTHIAIGDAKPNAEGRMPATSVRGDQPGLTQLREHQDVRESYRSYADQVIQILANVRFLDLAPDRMRVPTFPGATILGDGGENLPTVLEEICRDSGRQDILASWLEELTPMDVRGVEFQRDPSGRVNLIIRERNGRKVSAYSASDGTLRLLGLLAALLSPNPGGLYFFEEIDNGIHPARLHLLIDLIESQTKSNGIQVITTTHSPEMLNLINDDTFKNTSVVYRDEESSDAVIRPASDLPNAKRLRKSKGLGRLHSTGWMEDMLAFAEADREAGEAGE